MCRVSLVSPSMMLLVAAIESAAGNGEPIRLQASHQQAQAGAVLYAAACAGCHGPDGGGAPASLVAFTDPLPDFRDCAFATREPDGDWLAVVHDGGPARA